MSPEEISKKLSELGEGLRFIDLFVSEKLSERQQELARGLIDMFKAMNWQFALDNHKKMQVDPVDPIISRKCGTPVMIRSCRKEHGDKTYFGVFLGEVAMSPSVSIDKEGTMHVSLGSHNPAIFVPELKTVIFGCESWWGEIESEEELAKLITDETINNVWYVKALKAMSGKEEEPKDKK